MVSGNWPLVTVENPWAFGVKGHHYEKGTEKLPLADIQMAKALRVIHQFGTDSNCLYPVTTFDSTFYFDRIPCVEQAHITKQCLMLRN